jgi:glycerophosphoryl diester phosphodiesterase
MARCDFEPDHPAQGGWYSMSVPFWLQRAFHRQTDRIYARLPQPVPDRERLSNCKIVSHRGEHDNRSVLENTLPAFDRVLETGIWGVEFDIRWTRDLQPVVFHDRDLGRLFGITRALGDLTWSGLRAEFPVIPSLEEVISRYGKKMHLMMEIKESYRDLVRQERILRHLLSVLKPRDDFHVLSLAPALFQQMDFLPNQVFLPVAELNYRQLSALALRENYAGMAGHYLFLTASLIRRHAKCGQKLGAGYISSRNSLYRELNRGMEWIFSNTAGQLQSICDVLAHHTAPPPTALRQG